MSAQPHHARTLEDLLDLEEIRTLVLTYANRVDGGVDGDLADLFTEDGVWDSSDNGYPRLTSRAQIAEFFGTAAERRERGHLLHHSVQPTLVVSLDGDSARSVTSFTGQALFAGRSDVVVDAGRYHDEFARTPDGWRIRSRRLEHIIPTRIEPLGDPTDEHPRSRSWPTVD